MRKLKMHLHISLDGYASDAEGGFAWITYNDTIAAKAKELTGAADAVVFGPKTYKGMQSYWPTVPQDPAATPGELSHAAWLARSTKIVVSTNLPEVDADWDKSLLLRDPAELARLKAEPGGDIVSFGSPVLVRSCLERGLVDELHLFLNPLLLGGGQPVFGPGQNTKLRLLEALPLPDGVVALTYAPA
ncbi:MAG: dihydrofolate reductase [Devosia sp.]|uniref:dihydrofolate reductase family protein n=1 Tax=Devosia sp. TaxID=1871048 RepID=UPI002631AA24|nr:dihydrofolate reductase family protein [Devosia sp.]MDB5539969.1 dihydrofolate reductase [Devosia sp.]